MQADRIAAATDQKKLEAKTEHEQAVSDGLNAKARNTQSQTRAKRLELDAERNKEEDALLAELFKEAKNLDEAKKREDLTPLKEEPSASAGTASTATSTAPGDVPESVNAGASTQSETSSLGADDLGLAELNKVGPELYVVCLGDIYGPLYPAELVKNVYVFGDDKDGKKHYKVDVDREGADESGYYVESNMFYPSEEAAQKHAFHPGKECWAWYKNKLVHGFARRQDGLSKRYYISTNKNLTDQSPNAILIYESKEEALDNCPMEE